MKRIFSIFLIGNFCATSLCADSLLTAQQFPKTFEDLSFKSRLEVLRKGSEPYDVEYDDNGVCISGCAYPGITLKDDMEAVDEATEEMAALIENEEAAEAELSESEDHEIQDSTDVPAQQDSSIQSVAPDWCKNGLSTELPLRYPVDMTNYKYKISSDFGLRTGGPNGGGYLHGGLDISTPKGTPVYATADGVVVAVKRETKPGGAGLYINIRHKNGLITQYLHLDEKLVSEGQQVRACDKIALSGNSGTSKEGKPYSAHLDYRVRFESDKSKFVDILCPCKSAKRISNAPGGYDGITECAHSLFQNNYKFSGSTVKRVDWRIRYGHCMRNRTDLLPDEIAQ